MSEMNPVVHFELPAEDSNRMSEFNINVFGWKIQQLAPEMGNYIVAQTTDTDEKGMINKPGAINGGFYKKKEDPIFNSPSIVIEVTDINKTINEIKIAGGKVLGQPM